jgi:hypothetical protein
LAPFTPLRDDSSFVSFVAKIVVSPLVAALSREMIRGKKLCRDDHEPLSTTPQPRQKLASHPCRATVLGLPSTTACFPGRS